VEVVTVDAAVIHITDHEELVDRVVAAVYRKHRDWVVWDDLQQEAAVWWYSDRAQRHLAAYLEDEPYFTRLRRSIWRFLSDYAAKEKAAQSGYHARDQYPYSPGEVLDLIPIAIDPDGLPAVGHHEGPAPHGNLAEGGDTLAALIDVRRGIAALPEDDLHFLTLADDCSYDWERVATRLADGVLADSHRRRHARIAERIARWLSNEEDYQ
jgi:hypothetical protein